MSISFIKRGIELGLVAAIAVGLFFVREEGRERAGLVEDYARLRSKTGDLEVPDPSKFYVLAIPTGEPLRFAWRFHGPKGTPIAVSSFLGGSSSSSTIQSPVEDLLPTIRLRFTDERGLEIHSNFQSTSGIFSTGDRTLAGLIRGRESEVVVEQLGEPMVALKAGTHTLLRLRFSDAMMRDAERMLTPEALGQFPGGAFFRVEVGYTPPKTAPPSPGGQPPGAEASP